MIRMGDAGRIGNSGKYNLRKGRDGEPFRLRRLHEIGK